MTCKGCQIKETAANVDVQAMIEEQLAFEWDLAPKEVVQTRIAICQNCPFRLDHTCTKCGCFYEFRAHLPTKQCPTGKWIKVWDD